MGKLSNSSFEEKMRKIIRKVLPKSLKLQIKLFQRFILDLKKPFVYSKNKSLEKIGNFSIELSQPIMPSEFFENKIHNLTVVSEKINHLIIQPGEVFSFWKTVGKPSLKNGFKEGRNLIQNKISTDLGGGICQFSSILYYLAIQSGLQIIERYSHSLDIYKEHERFTPLGSDCTVSYGYKDLQILNSLSFPIQFYSKIEDNRLILEIISNQKIEQKNIHFLYHETKNGVEVETIMNDKKLFKNFYKRL